LYVTGRLKDLVIIRGRNHYPQDIERTAAQSHRLLRGGGGAAFSVDVEGREQLVVVQEVERRSRGLEVEEVAQAVRRAVAEVHEVQVYGVALIRFGTIPRTSSGKIRRHACREGYLSGSLKLVGSSLGRMDEGEAVGQDAFDRHSLLALESPQVRRLRLEEWLQEQAAALLRASPSRLNRQQPLHELGLDSLSALEFKNRIEARLGVILPWTDFLQGPSLSQLAAQSLALLEEPSHPSSGPVAPQGPAVEFPLSCGQKALWFLHQLAPQSPAYNLAAAAQLEAELEVGALRRSLQALIDRHPSLRTSFAASGGDPLQRIGQQEVCFDHQDASSWTEAELEERLTRESRRPFHLQRDPLMRACLFTRQKGRSVFLLVVHHIVADFWSLEVLLHDLGQLYSAEAAGVKAALPPLRFQYADFGAWQADLLAGAEGERLFGYWQQQLAGHLPALALPTDRPRPPVQSDQGSSHSFQLGPALAGGIEELGRHRQATLFTTLLAVFQVLLHRYTNQPDILVGSPTSGRNRAEWAGLIGYFVNPVPLRADFAEDLPFTAFLDQVRDTVLAALKHQDYPFALLVDRLLPHRDPSRSPLAQAVFVWQKSRLFEEKSFASFGVGKSGPWMQWAGLGLRPLALRQGVSLFDLTLTMAEAEEGLAASLQYSTDLFDAATIRRMAGHLQSLAEGVVSNPDERIWDLPMMGQEERSQALAAARCQQREFSAQACLHRLFEGQALRHADGAAVSFEGEQLSYRELNARANRLAHQLLSLDEGVGAGAPVGICLQPSLEMVVGLLGILKAGAAYLPLDPAYPRDRLAFMMQDAAAAVLLTQQSLADRVPDQGAQPVWLESEAGWSDVSSNPESSSGPQNSAYVIYTSGSAGKPKGVVVRHCNVVRLFEATQGWFDFDAGDVWTLFHSYAFDFSVWEIWGALLKGGRLAVVPRASRSPHAFHELLCREEATVLNQTPSFFRQLIRAQESLQPLLGQALRLVILGGEALEPQSLRPWFDRRGDRRPRLVNMYGITETTVHVTCRPLQAADLDGEAGSLIGVPIPDLQAYLLDRRQQPVPLGVPGEICVGGAGLAQCYLNLPGLTAQRFIADPLGATPGARLYRSGDLGRRLPDGDTEYLGRIDQQVKIRGFRIELGEIEAALSSHPLVQQAAVLARQDVPGDKRLAAYLAAGASRPSIADLRSHLKKRLPDHMLPSAFVFLERLPLTPNGKLDRRSLPAPDQVRPDTGQDYVAPRTALETRLAQIWSEVLRVEQVGIQDNFFALGGDSILSIQVVARANQAGISLNALQVFQHQAIAELAQAAGWIGQETPPQGRPCDTSPGQAAPLLEADSQACFDAQRQAVVRLSGDSGQLIEDAYPLAPLQQGLLLHSLLKPELSEYLVQFTCCIDSPLNVEAFQWAWEESVRAHPVLRTAFVWEGLEEPLQAVYGQAGPLWRQLDWSALSADCHQQCLEEMLAQDRERGFDLSRAPLMRLTLIRLGQGGYRFVWSCHHLLLDGWSSRLVLKQALARYQGMCRGIAPCLGQSRPYRDYIAWLQKQDLGRARSYWSKQLEGFSTPTPLEVGRPQNASQPEGGHGQQEMGFSPELTESLQSMARRLQLTLNSLLQGVWAVLLSRYSGEEDVLFGITASGRPPQLAGIESMVGVFVNTLPLRVRVPAEASLQAWLKELQSQQAEMRLFEYSPLAEVQKWSQVTPGRPLFDSLFAFENFPADESLGRLGAGLGMGGSRLLSRNHYPLTLAVEPRSGLSLRIGYDSRRFSHAAIGRMLGHVRTLAESFAADPDRPLCSLSLLTQSEKRLLLQEWNATDREYRREAGIGQLFEEQSKERPEAVALVFEGSQLSYGELERRSNQLAHQLRARGVGPEALVGICLERSLEMVIGILGIIQAGGAYLPLDPSYPRQRLGWMLADAGAPLLLARQDQLEQLQAGGAGWRSLCLEQEGEAVGRQPEESPQAGSEAENLAYVMYTSGSTGRPKGVAVTQRGVVRLVQGSQYVRLGPEQVMLMMATISFDASTFQIWGSLLNGARLVLYPPQKPTLEELGRKLEQERVSYAG
ncbi:MAG: amino acid adenylation domain-containing protein, partial [Acidobacteriota bacterium]